MIRPWFSILVCAGVCLTLAAQDPERSVDSRLLEILKKRGVITDSEFVELKELEADLKKEAALESAVSARVDEMVARLDEDKPKFSYKQGSGWTFKSGDGRFSMTMGGRIQVRATYSARENENGNQNDEDLQDFSVQRARLWWKGHAFDPNLRYEIQLEVAGSQSTPANAAGFAFDSEDTSLNRFVALRYAFVDWQICDDKPWYNLKAGQFKVPYSRHQLTSTARLEFVDRASTDPAFAPGFSYGAMFWGRRGGENDELFEYYAGVFDGPAGQGNVEGVNINNNDDGLLYAGRVAVNPFGALAYAESDLRACPDRDVFKLAFGVNAYYHQDNNRSGTNFDDWAVGADLAMAWRGWFFLGELHYRNDAQPNANDDLDVFGWMAQIGYMVVPQKFEVGIRVADANWDGTTAIAPATVPSISAAREYLAVLGYFWHEHNLKLQLDFGRAEIHYADDANGPNARNTDEWRARMQFQIVF